MTTLESGKLGEEAAKTWLTANGFTIRHCNWRWGSKELDIVAQKGANLHIIEVKTRKASPLVAPQVSVDKQKQRNTVFAANAYVQKFQVNLNVQMDIIAVVENQGQCTVEYIPNAYYPTTR